MASIAVQNHVRFERILFPTDCTGEDSVALRYAAGLAQHFSAHLALTNFINLAQTLTALDVLSGPALDSLRSSGERDLHRLAAGVSGISLSQRVVEGFEPASQVLGEAVNDNADLIILATNCKHGFAHSSLGSKAEEIIAEAPCPVLCIGPRVPKPPEGDICFQRILCATDFSCPARNATGIALSLGATTGAKVFLCHVVSKKEVASSPGCDEMSIANLQALVPESAREWCHAECCVEHGKAPEAILALAKRVNADLIVLGAHKRTFWLNFIHGGITAALLADARCPLMTVSSLCT